MARFDAFDTSGSVVGAGSIINGSANRADPAAGTHDTSGTLTGSGSIIVGDASRDGEQSSSPGTAWGGKSRQNARDYDFLDPRPKQPQEEPEQAEELEQEIVKVQAKKAVKPDDSLIVYEALLKHKLDAIRATEEAIKDAAKEAKIAQSAYKSAMDQMQEDEAIFLLLLEM